VKEAGVRPEAAAGVASELVVELVRTPSVSGEEVQVAELLEGWARSRGIEVSRDDAAVRMSVAGHRSGRTLLLASHLDTVPPGEGWTVDPFAGVVSDGRLVGRGAVDAKASVAAMAAALVRLAAEGGVEAGRLELLATYGEETRGTTMPEALWRLGEFPDAAIVGEPTGLAPAVAQRGQLLLRLTWQGEQMHAGWASERPEPPRNAILAAAADLRRLAELPFDRVHPRLGRIAVTPTMLQAGVARNVTPPRCELVLDVRSTPEYDHAELVRTIAGIVEASVEVLSDRLVPAETPLDSALLPLIRTLRPDAESFGSPTCSDWVWLRSTDAVKLGPGNSRLSHTANEWIDLTEVEEAASFYAAVARGYLR
jgi:acetylornithine deacetylase